MTKRISEPAAGLRGLRAKRVFAVALVATAIAVPGARVAPFPDPARIVAQTGDGSTPPGDSGEGPN